MIFPQIFGDFSNEGTFVVLLGMLLLLVSCSEIKLHLFEDNFFLIKSDLHITFSNFTTYLATAWVLTKHPSFFESMYLSYGSECAISQSLIYISFLFYIPNAISCAKAKQLFQKSLLFCPPSSVFHNVSRSRGRTELNVINFQTTTITLMVDKVCEDTYTRCYSQELPVKQVLPSYS